MYQPYMMIHENKYKNVLVKIIDFFKYINNLLIYAFILLFIVIMLFKLFIFMEFYFDYFDFFKFSKTRLKINEVEVLHSKLVNMSDKLDNAVTLNEVRSYTSAFIIVIGVISCTCFVINNLYCSFR
jgi:hypothetical protein